VFVEAAAAQGLPLDDIKDLFKTVGKSRKDGRKVSVQVQEFVL
jgi:hypothetical protein